MVFDLDAVWVFMCVAAVRLMLVISYWFRQLLSLKVPPKSDEVIKLTVKKASQKKNANVYAFVFGISGLCSYLGFNLVVE